MKKILLVLFALFATVGSALCLDEYCVRVNDQGVPYFTDRCGSEDSKKEI